VDPRYEATRLIDAVRSMKLAAHSAERERWPREQLARYQRERIEACVRHAAACSPYYRERIGGGPVDLGALGAPGDAYSASHASAVNDRGQVLGWSQTEAFPDGHAVVWDGGVIVHLGIAYQSAEASRATDVNAAGVIVGQSAVAPQVPMVDGVHAVVWTPTGPAKR